MSWKLENLVLGSPLVWLYCILPFSTLTAILMPKFRPNKYFVFGQYQFLALEQQVTILKLMSLEMMSIQMSFNKKCSKPHLNVSTDALYTD